MRSYLFFFLGFLTAFGVVGFTGRQLTTPTPSIQCQEIASQVGLDHVAGYGPVPADEEGARLMQRNMGHGAAVADYDADGDLDVFLLSAYGAVSRLFRNTLSETGEFSFVDVTADAGVSDVGLSRAASFTDLDGDGLLDLVLVNDYGPDLLEHPSKIFRNTGNGSFIDVTGDSGFDPAGYIVGGLSVTDLNSDGLPDLYVAYWTMELGITPQGDSPRGVFPGSNRLYLNRGDFKFEDVTDAFGLGDLTMDSFSGVFHDFTNDGRLDLYQAFDHRSDRLYSLIDGTFVDRSTETGVGHKGNSMGLAVGDVNDDGWMDVFVSNIWDPLGNFGSSPPGNVLMIGGDEGFIESAFASGVRESGWGWGASFVDLDLDGHLDLAVAQGFDELTGRFSQPLTDDKLYIFAGHGTGAFEKIEESGCDLPGDQRSLIPFDADRDGRVDLLVTQVDSPALLLRNVSDSRNSVTISFASPGSADLGAVARVKADGRTQLRSVVSSTSYLSGLPSEVVVGLGGADRAEEIVIEWPDGLRRRFLDVSAGTHLVANREEGTSR